MLPASSGAAGSSNVRAINSKRLERVMAISLLYGLRVVSCFFFLGAVGPAVRLYQKLRDALSHVLRAHFKNMI
jgi:hypothetical protein